MGGDYTLQRGDAQRCDCGKVYINHGDRIEVQFPDPE
jgi:hypothetical protein